jgi:hypothetical protein
MRDGGECPPTSTLSPLERRAAFGLPLQIFDNVDRCDDQPADNRVEPAIDSDNLQQQTDAEDTSIRR